MILVAVLILSFLMFFAFTINTGLLISAKISVQTAADAAAYAGAASQARILNSLSFLNYDMRRQYKKYIFRTTFVGSIGSTGFPNPNEPGPIYDFPKIDNRVASKKTSLKVPVVCIPITVGGKPDDNCLQVNIQDTSFEIKKTLGGGNLNQITKTLIDQINNITEIQRNLCQGKGKLNLFVLLAWLFRGDSSAAALDKLLDGLVAGQSGSAGGIKPEDFAEAKKTLATLVSGMGLYPRNTLTYMRARTLEGFLNQPASLIQNKTFEEITALENSEHAEANERTIQAYKSALANLNGNVFDVAQTSITELQKDQQIKLKARKVSFNAYVQMMLSEAVGKKNSDGSTFCNSAIFRFPAVDAPVGFYIEDPSLKVNYAVKIKAYVKPRGLLFLPGSSSLELDAVAGAKPFGSRIGPLQFSNQDLITSIKPNAVNGISFNDGSGPSGYFIPNLKIGADSMSLSVDFLTELLDRARNANKEINFKGLLDAERHAMAPTPEEVGRYNIIPPVPTQGSDDERNYLLGFIDYAKNRDYYRFYAPIFPKSGGNPDADVDRFISDMFPETEVNENDFGIKMKEIGQQAAIAIKDYIHGALESGKNPEGETLTLASIQLPMSGLTEPKSKKPFWLTKTNEVLSSWAPESVRTNRSGGSQAFSFKPRFSYSVKFVAMPDLIAEGVAAADEDVSKVTH